MYFDNIDILNIIQQYLYIKNNILLTSTSKFFYINIDIPKYIKQKYNYSFEYFTYIYLDVFKYNIILNLSINENLNFINLIKNNFPTRFKHTLYNNYEHFIDIINYETDYTDKYGYVFEFLLYKIYLINFIYPIFHHFFSDSISFCLLFSETNNENKKIKYSFDIDIINNYHIFFYHFYNIIKYNSILFNKFFNN